MAPKTASSNHFNERSRKTPVLLRWRKYTRLIITSQLTTANIHISELYATAIDAIISCLSTKREFSSYSQIHSVPFNIHTIAKWTKMISGRARQRILVLFLCSESHTMKLSFVIIPWYASRVSPPKIICTKYLSALTIITTKKYI